MSVQSLMAVTGLQKQPQNNNKVSKLRRASCWNTQTLSVTQTSVETPPLLCRPRCVRKFLGSLKHLLPVSLILNVFTPVANGLCGLQRTATSSHKNINITQELFYQDHCCLTAVFKVCCVYSYLFRQSSFSFDFTSV